MLQNLGKNRIFMLNFGEFMVILDTGEFIETKIVLIEKV
jgi:hypothetical protein